MIYFFQVTLPGKEPGPIKIGCTENVRQRIADCQQMIPWDIVLLGTCEGTFPEETQIHWRLFRHRIRRDRSWYAPHPDVLHAIAKLTAKVAVAS